MTMQRQVVAVRNPNDETPLSVEMEGAATAANQERLIEYLGTLNALMPAGYDQVTLEYSGEDLTRVTFRAKGETIGSLEMTYSNRKLVNVQRS